MRRKLCRAAGCEDIAAAGRSLCDRHQAEADAITKERRAKAQTSEAALKGRALYADPRWVKASREHLKRHPLCEDCAELGAVVAATEVDHKVRHRGDPKLFWDRKNWQSLCHRCHSRKTAREVFHGA